MQEQASLDKINKIQIEHQNYKVVDSDDDIMSLGDELICELIWRVPMEQDYSSEGR